MPRPERWFNILLAISISSWGLLGFLASNDGRSLFIRGSATLLHLTVAILIFQRNRIKRQATINQILVSVPSLLIGGWAFSLSPKQWPPITEFVFVIGCMVAVTSFAFLGKSFSILPALRGIISNGPYRWIRHPAYLGELLMVAGCCFANLQWISAIVLVASIIFVAIRSIAEEKLLSNDPAYLKYANQVRWRLLPGVW